MGRHAATPCTLLEHRRRDPGNGVRRVFVYGTLRAGEANHHLLASARLLAEARTEPRFALYDLGAYPGLVRAGAQAVVGEVYAVDPPTLAALDRLVDHPRFYRRTRITLADGRRALAYLLTLAQVVGRPVIASGDWRAHRRRRG